MSNQRRRTRARELALKILYQIDVTGENSQKAISDFLERHAPEGSIKNFAQQLVTGTIENSSRIDETITRCADNWEIKRMAVVDRNILRFATYELLFIDDISPKVSINEAVDIAKKYGDVDSGKFVNGILDKIAKSECKKLIPNP
jgi:transcription antitermination factor NusB